MSLVTTGQMNESDVFALLKLISDPTAAKQRLAELQKLEVALDAREVELRAQATDLETLKAKLTVQMQDFDERSLKFKAANDALLAERAALEQRATEVEAMEERYAATVAAKAQELHDKAETLERARSYAAKLTVDAKAEITTVKAELEAREKAVAEREREVEIAEAAYARKADRLRKELEA